MKSRCIFACCEEGVLGTSCNTCNGILTLACFSFIGAHNKWYNVKDKDFPVDAMKAYRLVEVWLLSCLTSALDGCE